MIMSLFQDATADALKTVAEYSGAGNESRNLSLDYYMTAGTVSATTFKIRIGGSTAGTTTFNGIGAARLFGGVAGSSITITEIQA